MRTLASMLRSRTPGSLLKLGAAPAAVLASLVSPSGDSQHHVRLVVVMKTYFNEDGVEMYVPLRPKGFGAPWPEEYLTVAYIRHDRTKQVQVVTILLTIAAVMAVILRLVARRRTKATGWDDYLIVVGLVSSPLLLPRGRRDPDPEAGSWAHWPAPLALCTPPSMQGGENTK